LLRGPRLGVANNFFALLGNQDEDSEYFAFCDQDDVWLPEKIERAVLGLREYAVDEPLMYFSRVELVDENLKHLSFSRVPKRIGFTNALVEKRRYRVHRGTQPHGEKPDLREASTEGSSS